MSPGDARFLCLISNISRAQGLLDSEQFLAFLVKGEMKVNWKGVASTLRESARLCMSAAADAEDIAMVDEGDISQGD